jgi:CPA2 family monovalent cation:H+ antiporter-2
MHHVPLLVNIAVALGYALLGGLVARKLGLPTIVGYLLAGVALGPFTPGFSGDIAAIQQLAELRPPIPPATRRGRCESEGRFLLP